MESQQQNTDDRHVNVGGQGAVNVQSSTAHFYGDINFLGNQLAGQDSIQPLHQILEEIMAIGFDKDKTSDIRIRRELLEQILNQVRQLSPEPPSTQFKEQEVTDPNEIACRIRSARLQIQAITRDNEINVLSGNTVEQMVKLLQHEGILVIEGIPGSGKTHLALTILSELEKECFEPIIVRNLYEMRRSLDGKGKKVILVEELLGRHTVNEGEANEWDKHIDELLSRVKLFDELFVFTIRSNIFKASAQRYVHEKLFRKEKHVELRDDNFDKQKLLRLFASRKEIELSDEHIAQLSQVSPQSIGFPFLCSQMKGTFDDIMQLFTKPKDAIKANIRRLVKSRNIEYVTLLLTLLFSNQLDATMLSAEKNLPLVTKVREICCEFQNVQEIADSAKALDGTYLKRDGDLFHFINEFVLEIFFEIASENHLAFLIQESPIQYISLFAANITMSDCFLKKLIQRFSCEVDCLSTAECSLWNDKLFLGQVIQERGIDFFYTEQNNVTLFEAFGLLGSQKVIELIVQKQHDAESANDINTIQSRVMKSACLKGNQTIVDTLVDVVEITDEMMICAVKSANSVEMIDYLYNKGVNLCATLENNDSILTEAIILNKKDMLIYLWTNHDEVFTGLLDAIRQNEKNAMHLAISHGSVDCLQFLLTEKPELSFEITHGQNALHVAAGRNDLQMLDLILKSWRSTDNLDGREQKDQYTECLKSLNTDGRNALHISAISGDVNCLDCLIKAGIPGNSTTITNLTILHIAAANGNIEMIEYIFENMLDIKHDIDDCGRSALHYAVLSKSIDTVDKLIKAGLDPNITDSNSQNLFHTAVVSGCVEMIEYIGATQNQLILEESKDSWTALHIAALKQGVECIELLLRLGLQADSVTKFGHSILHISVGNGNTVLMEYLSTRHRYLLSGKDILGNSPLHIASIDQSVSVFDYLVRSGLQPNIVNRLGHNTFHTAALFGNKAVLKYMIDNHNCMIHESDAYGFNAIHFASLDQPAEIVSLLLNAGIRLTASKVLNINALHIASCKGNVGVVKVIVAQNKNVVQSETVFGLDSLHFAITSACLPHILMLLKMLEQSHREKVSISTFNHTNLIQILDCILETLDDPKAIQDMGFTYSSSKRRSLEVTKVLVKAGISAKKPTLNGFNAFHLAVFVRNKDVVQYLLGESKDIINCVDSNGRNALHFAVQPDLINVFLRNAFLITNLINLVLDYLEKGDSSLNSLSYNIMFGLINQLKLDGQNNGGNTNEETISQNLNRAGCRISSNEIKKYLVASGIKSVKHGEHKTRVFEATAVGNIDIINVVSESYDTLLDETGNFCLRAIHFGSDIQCIEIVQLLTGNGMSSDSTTKKGHTCLHIAAELGNMAVVKYIVDNFGNILNSRDNLGWNALHYASKTQRKEVVKYIIGAGLNSDTTTNNGLTILHIAALSGNVDVVRFVIEQYRYLIHKRDKDGLNALHHASLKQPAEMLQLLLDAGIEPESTTRKGHTCLHIAADHGNLAVMKYFIDKHKHLLDVTDLFGWNALHFAAAKHGKEMVQCLIESGMNPESTTKGNASILHIATGNGKLDIVRYIVQNHKGLLRKTDINGWNALHHASVKQPLEMIHLLIAAGIQPESTAKNGMTCFQIAALTKNTFVANFFLWRKVKIFAIENILPFILHQLINNWV